MQSGLIEWLRAGYMVGIWCHVLSHNIDANTNDCRKRPEHGSQLANVIVLTLVPASEQERRMQEGC